MFTWVAQNKTRSVQEVYLSIKSSYTPYRQDAGGADVDYHRHH
jgi:hypothetical protein